MRTIKNILSDLGKTRVTDETKITVTNISYENAKKREDVVFEGTYAALIKHVREKNAQVIEFFKKKNVELYGFSRDKKNIEFLVA